MTNALLSPGFADLGSLVGLGPFRVTDGVVLLLLLLFGIWGGMRGAVRQSLAILILAGALYAAGPLAPLLEPTIGKVSGLFGDEQLAAAWIAAFLGCLVVGAILLAFLTPRLPEPSVTRRARLAGGLLGMFKGSVVLLILAYFVLGGVGGPMPGLRRDGAAPAGPGLVQRLQGTVSAGLLSRGSTALTDLVDVPPWIHERVASVNEELGAETVGPAAGGRPRSP